MKKNVIFFVAFLLITIQQLFAQNVGVGTSNPSQKLDVSGNVNITGTIMANGTAGSNGQVLTSTGSGLSWSSIGSQMGYKKCKVFMSFGAGSFTVPAGVTEVMVEAWGAGSGGGGYCGGTSGGYARTVQSVSAGANITFNIGKGSPCALTSPDGRNTTINFPGGGIMNAYGGGGVGNYLNTYTKGLAKSGDGTVSNGFYMFGNQGGAPVTIVALNNTLITESVQYGSGGAPVASINATPIQGAYHYKVNSDVQYAVLASPVKTPSAGGPGLLNGEVLSGGDGMVIIWFN